MIHRSYDDSCGVARAMDLVGERWALLIARELLLGAKRFGDLRSGLPRVSQNVLTTRLKELTEAGIIHRLELGPPTSAWAYELTALGHALEPALVQLGRWGALLPDTDGAEQSPDAFLLSLRAFYVHGNRSAETAVGLVIGPTGYRVSTGPSGIHIERDSRLPVDVTVTGGVPVLRQLFFGGDTVAQLTSAGQLSTSGDASIIDSFVRLFPTPTLATV